MKEINSFKGDFEFLSNFSPHGFRDDSNVLWRTNEHYYQAMKTTDMVERGKIWSAETPGRAKRIGQTVTIRDFWNSLQFDFMTQGVTLKFLQNEDIKMLLLSTNGYKLVEGNLWHDNIWGECMCNKCFGNIEGKNWLGEILMIVREVFTNE